MRARKKNEMEKDGFYINGGNVLLGSICIFAQFFKEMAHLFLEYSILFD